jgi:hypothetical protein
MQKIQYAERINTRDLHCLLCGFIVVLCNVDESEITRGHHVGVARNLDSS